MAKLLEIVGLGGMNEIGASGVLIKTTDNFGNTRNILVDSGIRMINEPKDGRLAKRTEGHILPDCPIGAILLTHAHTDHVGNAPVIIKSNPSAKVFMTRPTFYIAGALWLNTLYLMKNQKIEVSLNFLSDFADGVRMIVEDNKDKIVNKPGWINIFPGIDAYFGPNGHIRGSAFIVLKIGEKMIMFSGDMSVYDSPTVKGMSIPQEFIGKLDAVFTESTYGDRQLVDRREEEDRMAELAKKTIRNGGSCLFPAFGVGRSPDVLIAQMIRGVKPLYIDGMGRQMLEIYASSNGSWCDLDHSSGVDLNSDSIKMIYSKRERSDLIYSGIPFSVVTTAGMMTEGSCAMQYALNNNFLGKPKNLLGLTGFQAEYTEGREIEEGVAEGRPVEIAGRRIVVRAQVPPRFNLSSHADGFQIAHMVSKLEPKKVFINHGNEKGREGLEGDLRLLGYQGEIYKPENGAIIKI